MKADRFRFIKKLKNSEQGKIERLLAPLKQKKLKLEKNLVQLRNYLAEYKTHYANSSKNNISLKAFELVNEQNFLENLKAVIEMNHRELVDVQVEIAKLLTQWQTLKHYQDHLDKKIIAVEQLEEQKTEKRIEREHYAFLARKIIVKD